MPKRAGAATRKSVSDTKHDAPKAKTEDYDRGAGLLHVALPVLLLSVALILTIVALYPRLSALLPLSRSVGGTYHGDSEAARAARVDRQGAGH
eukprot:2297517-Rhodomonas_salina.4